MSIVVFTCPYYHIYGNLEQPHRPEVLADRTTWRCPWTRWPTATARWTRGAPSRRCCGR